MKCLNWKVVAAVAAAAVVMWAIAPGSVGALAPLLVLAICPLSMLLMMRAMGSGASCATDRDAEITKLRAELDDLRADRPNTARGL
jgi:hypothetical protein